MWKTKKKMLKHSAFFFHQFLWFFIKKSIILKNYLIFFLVVSRLFRRVLKTFSEKNLKKIKFSFFSKKTNFCLAIFRFIKKIIFLKNCSIFFLFVSRPLRKVFKTFSVKNSIKIKILFYVKKFEHFFSVIFSIFWGL